MLDTFSVSVLCLELEMSMENLEDTVLTLLILYCFGTINRTATNLIMLHCEK